MYFLQNDLVVSEVRLVVFVAPRTGALTHRNRPSFGLALNCEGKRARYLFADGTEITVNGGEMIFLPRGSDYEVVEEAAGEGCYAINFDLTDPPDAARPCRMIPRNLPFFLNRFRAAEREWRGGGAGRRESCLGCLYEILGKLREEQTAEYAGGKAKELLAPAVAYIHAHYTEEKFFVAELAAMCGVSEVYFREKFRTVYGVSPVSYVTGLRLSRACELIGSGVCSVTDACFMSGFSDIGYFSRTFRRAMGVSPSAYRGTGENGGKTFSK